VSVTPVERTVGVMAAAATAAGLIIAGVLVPSAVDHITDSDAYGTKKVLVAAQHATAVRVGYLALIVALLCIAPATRRVLLFAPRRGAALVNVAWRVIAVGAAAGAVGNAFAPLIVPSGAPFDPAVMGAFIHHHETSAVSYAILAVYLLLPVGALLLIVGLLRAATIPWWGAVALGLSLGAITPLRLGPQAVVDGFVLAGALAMLHLRPTPVLGATPDD
jgi:hypothetical protein